MARRTVALLVGVLCLAAASCSGDDDGGGGATTVPSSTQTTGGSAPDSSSPVGTNAPQPLSAEQAELLATMRVANYRAVESSFTTSVTDEGDAVDLHGVVNWQQHTGSAVFRAAGRTDDNGHGLMQWNFEKVAAHAGGDLDGPPPPPPEDGTWLQRAIDPSTSSIDALFLVLISVASPEPDNPQLLRQTDAAYLGAEIINGQTASVFAGPTSDAATESSTAPTAAPMTAAGASPPSSNLTYWVAPDGKLLRLRAELGNQTVTADFAPAPTTPTEYLPDLVTPS